MYYLGNNILMSLEYNLNELVFFYLQIVSQKIFIVRAEEESFEIILIVFETRLVCF